jgi:hypothetical protein
MDNNSIDILSEIITDKKAKLEAFERKALSKSNVLNNSESKTLQSLREDINKDIDSMEIMINLKRKRKGKLPVTLNTEKEISPYHSFIPSTRKSTISNTSIAGHSRGHSRNTSYTSQTPSSVNQLEDKDDNLNENDNNVNDNEMMEDTDSSVQTDDNENSEAPPKHFNKGIEIIAKKKSYLFCKIIAAETYLSSTTFGIKENEKEFPPLPSSSKEQSKVEYQVLKNNNLEKIRNDRTLTIQEYLEKYKSASSSLNIKLGFPETSLVNCPLSFRLTYEMIARIKHQINIRTWQICAAFEKKRTEDISKKLLKQEKFLLLKEKRLLENTPEAQLERLRKEVLKLSLKVGKQQKKTLQTKDKKATKPATKPLSSKKKKSPANLNTNAKTKNTGPNPVGKNILSRGRIKPSQKQTTRL